MISKRSEGDGHAGATDDIRLYSKERRTVAFPRPWETGCRRPAALTRTLRLGIVSNYV